MNQTIKELNLGRKSIARFGDGEYMLAQYSSIGFQRKDLKLSLRLLEILKNENPNCIIALQQFRTHHLTDYWKRFWFQNMTVVCKMFPKNTTRPYFSQGISRESNLEQIKSLSRVWKGRNVVFVTGKGSRFDPNHELFKEVASHKTAFGLPSNAWREYGELFDRVLIATKDVEDPLVICALGPTATVLCYDLSLHDVQALDLGHVTNAYDRKKYGGVQPEHLPMSDEP